MSAAPNYLFKPAFVPDDQFACADRGVRDERLAILRSLVSFDADSSMPILREKLRGSMIAEPAARHGTAKDKIYARLHSWRRYG